MLLLTTNSEPPTPEIFFCCTPKVILASVASLRRTLEEVEGCKGELRLPRGAEDSLLIFSRARALLQMLRELEQLAEQQLKVQVPLQENK